MLDKSANSYFLYLQVAPVAATYKQPEDITMKFIFT